MAIDYLIEIERQLSNGRAFYVCRGAGPYDWHMSEDLEEIRPKAQRLAQQKNVAVEIRRLTTVTDSTTDSYLVLRTITEPESSGEPRLEWMIVGSREAAEMLRDISQGPSPYFGTELIEIVGG
jgi:hypothetical protein